MLFSSTYKEIKDSSIGIYKEKNSKFIAYTFRIYSESDVRNKINEIKKIENSAHHYCYAYVINIDKSAQRVNDDGEPSYSAGKPILTQIHARDITNIIIIVVRYFGGVKLGIPGLIRSYKNAASNALDNTRIITRYIKEKYQIIFKYYQTNVVMKIINDFKIEVINTDYKIDCNLILVVQRNNADLVKERFKILNIEIKYIKDNL